MLHYEPVFALGHFVSDELCELWHNHVALRFNANPARGRAEKTSINLDTVGEK
jgi:hypothetical protein